MGGRQEEELVRLTPAETLSLLCCLLKDLGWVLLLPSLAFPAALVAFGAESYVFSCDWKRSAGIRVHAAAQLLWLVGNIFWMSAELLFDPEGRPGHRLPWYSGPLVSAHVEAYEVGRLTCKAFFVVGIGILVAFYSTCAVGALRLDARPIRDPVAAVGAAVQVPEPLVLGLFPAELYLRMFIGPWIVKDLLWCSELAVATVLFGFIAMLIPLDNLRRFGGSSLAAECFWFSGNWAWSFAELALRDEYQLPRFFAAGLLLAGVACSLRGLAFGGMAKAEGEDSTYASLLAERVPVVSS